MHEWFWSNRLLASVRMLSNFNVFLIFPRLFQYSCLITIKIPVNWKIVPLIIPAVPIVCYLSTGLRVAWN